jgi:hypothetical protein
VSHFAKFFRNIDWTPSDVDKRYFESINAFIKNESLENVQEPQFIDITTDPEDWLEPVKSTKFDIIYCANMMHISPFPCTVGLYYAAGKVLKPSTGLLITYGPYAEGGNLEPESNVRFDEGLRNQVRVGGLSVYGFDGKLVHCSSFMIC